MPRHYINKSVNKHNLIKITCLLDQTTSTLCDLSSIDDHPIILKIIKIIKDFRAPGNDVVSIPSLIDPFKNVYST
jgi:hypothetical protein